jgi:hypothetical protein
MRDEADFAIDVDREIEEEIQKEQEHPFFCRGNNQMGANTKVI